MIEMQHNMLVLKKALDYETKNQYVINVQVTDDGKPPPAMTTVIKVIVNVQGESRNFLQTKIKEDNIWEKAIFRYCVESS